MSLLTRLKNKFCPTAPSTGIDSVNSAYVRMQEPTPGFFAIIYFSVVLDGRPGLDQQDQNRLIQTLPVNLKDAAIVWMRTFLAWEIDREVRTKYGAIFSEEARADVARNVDRIPEDGDRALFISAASLIEFWFPRLDACQAIPIPTEYPAELDGIFLYNCVARALLKYGPDGPIFTLDDESTKNIIAIALQTISEEMRAQITMVVEIGAPIQNL